MNRRKFLSDSMLVVTAAAIVACSPEINDTSKLTLHPSMYNKLRNRGLPEQPLYDAFSLYQRMLGCTQQEVLLGSTDLQHNSVAPRQKLPISPLVETKAGLVVLDVDNILKSYNEFLLTEKSQILSYYLLTGLPSANKDAAWHHLGAGVDYAGDTYTHSNGFVLSCSNTNGGASFFTLIEQGMSIALANSVCTHSGIVIPQNAFCPELQRVAAQSTRLLMGYTSEPRVVDQLTMGNIGGLVMDVFDSSEPTSEQAAQLMQQYTDVYNGVV